MQEIRLKPALEIRARLRVLYEIVDELTNAFAIECPQSATLIIRKGILEQQLLSAVNIYFINDHGQRVASVDLSIDWIKHEVRLEAGAEEFHIEQQRSVAEQISMVFPVFTSHVEQMRSALNVKRTEVWFTIRSDVDRDWARKVLGTGSGTPPKWAESATQFTFEFSSDLLDELSIKLLHGKP
jgi:hypothetical protein